MAIQVKSPKSVDTRPQRSITDTNMANTWRLSHPYLITIFLKRFPVEPIVVNVVCDSMQVAHGDHLVNFC